jgi:hypothetical protein
MILIKYSILNLFKQTLMILKLTGLDLYLQYVIRPNHQRHNKPFNNSKRTYVYPFVIKQTLCFSFIS